MANFTHEIEVSAVLIKIQLGVYHEMMVLPVVLYNFFIQSLHVRDLKNAFLLSRISRISSNTFCWLFFAKNINMQKFQIFYQKHGKIAILRLF